MKALYQSIQWHITEVCPNRCKHCYIDGMTNEERRCKELDFQGMLRILDNLRAFEEKYDVAINNFILTGGDPFEHPDFEKLLKELRARGKSISVLGIPERITKESLAMLESYQINQYQVSLDGMPDTHDMIRGKGSFDRTIKALKFMNQYSSILPAIMFTVHRQNWREMFDLIAYLEQEGIHTSFAFDFMVLEGSAKENFQLLDKEQVDELLEKYRKIRLQLKEKQSKLILREKVKLFETFDVTDANVKFEKYTYVSGCYCGLSSCCILPNGDCMPCRRLNLKIGNLLQESYTDLFVNHELMRRLRRISSFKMCCDCDYAKVCRGCAALAYSATGDAFGDMMYCSRKRSVEPKLHEPPLDCSEQEEFDYLTNTLKNAIQKEGIHSNKAAIKHNIYKAFIGM